MRLAVISDMHGNDVALEAALRDIDKQGVDQIVCLGDTIQGGPQPAETVARMRDRKIPNVMGNSDDWLLRGDEADMEKIPPDLLKKLEEVRQWSFAQLSQNDRDFIASFQPTITIDLGQNQSLLCYHGSPSNYNDIMLPDSPIERFQELLAHHPQTVFAGGHVHTQFLRQLDERFHFNPGSVGNAYLAGQITGDPKIEPFSAYAILQVQGANLSLEFRRVPFDVERLIDVFRTSGRPYAEGAIVSHAR
jgi:putative phosphoesterase